MLLLGPLARVGAVGQRPSGPLAAPPTIVLRPGGEREPAAGPADARELGRGALVVGREDRAERRGDRVELGVGVRKLLAVALVEPDLEPSAAAARRAFASWSAEMSIPTTSAPARAARSATPPVPQATSSTRAPGSIASAATMRSWIGAKVSAMRS